MRYTLALAVGSIAGIATFVATNGVVEPFRARFVGGLNAIVWTGAVALYVSVYERFGGALAGGDTGSTAAAAKWGGIAGGGASLGVSGIAVLLVEAVPNWYVAAVGSFVFGLFLLGMGVGTGSTATNAPQDGSGPTTRSGAAGDGRPADR